MTKTLVLFATLVALLVLAVPAGAVQYGTPDGDAHPQVGLVVFTVNGQLSHRCTGALIAPKVFLTAGHCTDGTDGARVWFDSGRPAGYPTSGGVTGTSYTHPRWSSFAEFPANYDIGVVVLDRKQSGPYASLAPQGTVDGLQVGQASFDLVGYGLQDSLPPVFTNSITRVAGEAHLVNEVSALNGGYNIQLSAAPGTGGALCFGDSGGPVFLKGTTTIVAVNSFVLNLQCMGSGFSYRTDTADSLRFVGQFLR